ncbi:MAG: restriction endonuclease subunit S [Zoogloea sp.]|nr:restriction endonuclease subunit S [Zoogloea sp.]
MEVKPGYKQTEIGVIPEGWKVDCLSNYSETSSGTTPARVLAERYFHGGAIPWVKTLDLNNTTINETDECVTDYALRETSLRLYPAGSVLVAMYGGFSQIGRTGLLSFPSTTNQAITAICPYAQKLDSKYLLYFLNHHVEYWKSVASSSRKDPNITGNDVRNFLIALPLLEEQNAIATALSDMDALLDGLGRLIAKKRAIKQATMQQLLTGQTRLPGFSGEWEMKTLSDVVECFVGGGTPSRANPAYWGNEIPWVTVKDFATFDPFLAQEYITKLGLLNSATNLIPAGTLITSTRMALGKAVVYEVDVTINQDLKALFLKPDVAVEFLFHWFSHYGERIDDLGSGSTVKGISVNELKRLPISLPIKDEQTAITAVLSDMDTEITALEARRTKTHALKQAMMQELLTGRTRLVEPGAKQPIEKEVAQAEGRKANVYFLRSVLAAEIIDQLHDQPTFGHVKFEKMMFLVEHLCDVDTGSTYHRKAAGPYDNRALRSIDSQLQKQQWFDARKEGERYRYMPMEKRGGHKQYFERYFPDIGDAFGKILGTFKTFDTERCEIVATLLAAWSDLLREKGMVSDETIVHEVLNNWHESKRRIPKERWLKALDWMRSQGFVPKGVA